MSCDRREQRHSFKMGKILMQVLVTEGPIRVEDYTGHDLDNICGFNSQVGNFVIMT